MRATLRHWVVAAAIVVLGAMVLAPDAMAESRRRNHRRRREKDPRYIVCMVKDSAGDMLFEVIKSDGLRERQKELNEDYIEAMKDWYTERKAAKKRREKFTEKKPGRPRIKKIGKTFKDEDKAQEFADKLQERWEKKHAPKDRGDDFDDDKPRRKKDKDDDDKPRRKKDKDDDEKPRKKGDEDDDEKPKKRKKNKD